MPSQAASYSQWIRAGVRAAVKCAATPNGNGRCPGPEHHYAPRVESMTRKAARALSRQHNGAHETLAIFQDGSIIRFRSNGISAPTCDTITSKLEIADVKETLDAQAKKGTAAGAESTPENPTHSLNTRKAYRSCWKTFTNWCRENQRQAELLTTEDVAEFLYKLAQDGRAKATVAMHRAAVKSGLDTILQPDNNPARYDKIKDHMKMIANRYGAPQKQAPPLSADDVERIRATACQPRTLPKRGRENPATAYRRGITDIAIAALMHDTLLRISEASAATWQDISMMPDGSARLVIPRSKTDQTATGQTRYVSEETAQDLINLRDCRDQPGPQETLFRMTPGQIARRLKKAATNAGITANISGHSPRVGMAQDLSADGMELPALMNAGGWNSASMPMRYTENLAASRGAVAQFRRNRRRRKKSGDSG